MSTKRHNLDDPKSCLNKAADNEPIFVLRANDPVASKVVRIWASLSESMKTQPREKCCAAWQVAVAMEAWLDERTPLPVPAPMELDPHSRFKSFEQLIPAAAPREDLWIKHTPGDPMPCSNELLVEVMTRRERDKNEWRSSPGRASSWMWGSAKTDRRLGRSGEVVAWRPA